MCDCLAGPLVAHSTRGPTFDASLGAWTPNHYGLVVPVIALATAALVLKHLVLIGIQGGIRVAKRRFAREEDARAFRGKPGEDPALATLAQEVIRNGLENEPLFLLLLLVLHQAQPDADLATYAWTFLAARYLHALVFLRRSQPLRTITFAVGLAATVGLAVQLGLYAIPLLRGG